MKARVYEQDGVWFYEDGIHNLIINLTLAFGKGKEPRTIGEFLKVYPKMWAGYHGCIGCVALKFHKNKSPFCGVGIYHDCVVSGRIMKFESEGERTT